MTRVQLSLGVPVYRGSILRQNHQNNNQSVSNSYTLSEMEDRKCQPFYYPVSFGMQTCDFPFLDSKGMHCPGCGALILTEQEYNEFLKKLDSTPEEKYIEYLKTYKPYMPDYIKEIFNEICRISSKNSDADLKQILMSMRTLQLPKLQRKQLIVINKVESFVEKNLEGNEYKSAKKLLRYTKEKIFDNTSKSDTFKRKSFISSVAHLDIADENKKLEIIEIARHMANSYSDKSAWIVKYGGEDKQGVQRGNREIAKAMLEPSLPNVDHIYPVSKGGKNSLNNYAAMHSMCNLIKNDDEFPEWLAKRPHRVKYYTRYLQDIQDMIDDKQIKRKFYKRYPERVIKTISDLTNNEVNINLSHKNTN